MLCLLALARDAALSNATTLLVDYRFDTQGFFNPATSNGAQARATVDAAAAFFSTIINDSLSGISPPTGSNIWRQIITHPGTGQTNFTISSAASFAQESATGWTPANEYRNISVASNQILIYAGATDLTSLGIGGTAFASYGTSGFNDNIARRGKPTSEYAAWGGHVSFDSTGVNWHLDHTLEPAPGTFDLYSTALHEIGHVLGLSTNNNQWNQYQAGAMFQGPESTAAWKADDPAAPANATGVPTASLSDRHWKDNVGSTPSVRSRRVGTTMLQEAAMDPTLPSGIRKRFTNVDTRALRDIGWTIPSSVFDVTVPVQPADFNADGQVNGVDLVQWKSAFGVNASANADGDADSDGNDFLAWQRRFGTSPAVASTAVIPEPATAAIAIAALGLVARRRGRCARPACACCDSL